MRQAQKADKSEKGSLAAALSLVFIGTGRVNSDSANDLVGTKAARADVDVTGSTVDDRFYATNISLFLKIVKFLEKTVPQAGLDLYFPRINGIIFIT